MTWQSAAAPEYRKMSQDLQAALTALSNWTGNRGLTDSVMTDYLQECFGNGKSVTSLKLAVAMLTLGNAVDGAIIALAFMAGLFSPLSPLPIRQLCRKYTGIFRMVYFAAIQHNAGSTPGHGELSFWLCQVRYAIPFAMMQYGIFKKPEA